MTWTSNRNTILIPVVFIFLAPLILMGCSQSFEPFQENDRYVFSMNGYLDASADTQWVRVMPVRDSFFLEPEPLDVTVTLEHMADGGESVILKDSLFYYGQGAYAWNYWTTMKLNPTETYRIQAERSDGRYSFAIVKLPEDFPDPTLHVLIDRPAEFLRFKGIENLAGIHSNHLVESRLTSSNFTMTYSHDQDTIKIDSDYHEYEIQLNPSKATENLEAFYEENPYDVLHREIFVASAGPDWPFYPDISAETVALPDGVSNVENGVGFVIGIVSRTIPWEITCFDEDEGYPIELPCRF